MRIPNDASLHTVLYVLIAIYGLALTRAWELIGGQRFSLLGIIGIITHHAPPARRPRTSRPPELPLWKNRNDGRHIR